MNRRELQQLSRLRVQDAKILLDNGRHLGAYYLLGYAVECALKACIAKQIRQHDFPDRKLVNDSYTHDLERLMTISGLKSTFDTEIETYDHLAANWAFVRDWSEGSRYETDLPGPTARNFYSAVTAPGDGVLSWLKRHW